jgi:hypothetical protein
MSEPSAVGGLFNRPSTALGSEGLAAHRGSVRRTANSAWFCHAIADVRPGRGSPAEWIGVAGLWVARKIGFSGGESRNGKLRADRAARSVKRSEPRAAIPGPEWPVWVAVNWGGCSGVHHFGNDRNRGVTNVRPLKKLAEAECRCSIRCGRPPS